MDRLKFKLVLAIIALLALTGCSGSSGGGSLAGGPPSTGLSIELNDASFFGGGSLGGIAVNTTTESGKLIAEVSIDNAKGLKGLFFELHYDAKSWHPVSANPTELLAPTDSLLHLAILGDPGVVHFGEAMLNPDTVDGFSGSGTVALVEFATGATPEPNLKKEISATPDPQIILRWWSVDQLVWKYSNSGDYDLNGEVNLADIVPIVLHFRKTIQGDDPRHIKVIDGDGNFEINLADLTVIVLNYGNSHIEGYNLFSSDNTNDLPENNGGTNGAGAEFVSHIPFANLLPEDQELSSVGRVLDFLEPVQNVRIDRYYWLIPVPVSGESHPPSSVASYRYFVNGYDELYEFFTKPELDFDAQQGLLTIYYQNAGDVNQDSVVLLGDGYLQISLVLENLQTTGPFEIGSILRVIDADSNLEINLADITPTVFQYTSGIAGYKVYTVSNPTDIENTKTLVADLPFSSALGDPETERLRFEFDTVGLDGEFGVIQAYTYLDEIAGQTMIVF